jgi:hypothetical protein
VGANNRVGYSPDTWRTIIIDEAQIGHGPFLRLAGRARARSLYRLAAVAWPSFSRRARRLILAGVTSIREGLLTPSDERLQAAGADKELALSAGFPGRRGRPPRTPSASTSGHSPGTGPARTRTPSGRPNRTEPPQGRALCAPPNGRRAAFWNSAPPAVGKQTRLRVPALLCWLLC